VSALVDLNYQLLGLKELNDGLKSLEPRKQINAIRNASRAAMKSVKATAESRVPKGDKGHKTYKGRWVAPGFAARNININTFSDRRTLTAGATLGTKKEAFYVRQFLELGTANIAPQPWLRPSYESNKGRMERDFRRSLRDKILQQARKVKKPRGMSSRQARAIIGAGK